MVTAVYILNLSPTKVLNARTPYETWHGRKSTVSHLRVFGCLVFAKELGHINKLDDRSTPVVFIGYAEGSKAYDILDPETQRVCTTRDVVFESPSRPLMGFGELDDNMLKGLMILLKLS